MHFCTSCLSVKVLCDNSGSGFQRLMRTPRIKFFFFLFARNGEVLLHARLILANSDHFWRNSHFPSLYRNDARLPGFSAPFVWLFNLLVLFSRLFLNSLDLLCGTAVTMEMEEVVFFFMRPSTSSHVDCSTAHYRPQRNTLNCWSGHCTIFHRYTAFCEFWYIYCQLDQLCDNQWAENANCRWLYF